MEHPDAPEWVQTFENKSVSEIQSMEVPKGLEHRIRNSWVTAQTKALRAAQAREAAAAKQAVRETLVRQIAARADQLRAEPEEALSAADNSAAPSLAPPVENAQSVEIPAPQDSAPHEFSSEQCVENLRERLATAIARNAEPLPEPVIRPKSAPEILPRLMPVEAMEIQMSSSAILVEGLVRQFRDDDFNTHTTCEIMKSMAILIAANAALGKTVHLHRSGEMGEVPEGRRSNGS